MHFVVVGIGPDHSVSEAYHSRDFNMALDQLKEIYALAGGEGQFPGEQYWRDNCSWDGRISFRNGKYVYCMFLSEEV